MKTANMLYRLKCRKHIFPGMEKRLLNVMRNKSHNWEGEE